ncbi:MAG: hypothetical protein ACI8X5_000311 [Planctomycetota bacterium]|jgi:hypothetical protein
MIRINLLPEEYRRKAKTPIKLMLAVAGVVTVSSSLAAYYGWLAYGVAASVSSELSVLETEDDGLRPQVAYHKALDVESSQHRKREETLAQITDSRISWTRKVDEFIDVVNQGGDGDRHLVWFDNLNVTQGVGGGRGKAGNLIGSGHSGSDNFGQVANFLDDIEGSTFIEDFHSPGSPQGSETLTDAELMPAVVWAFPLTIELKDGGVEQ